nr:MBL fold metallo-hydrolase [Bacteroides sp. 41_26]
MFIGILLVIVAVFALIGIVFINQSSFGKLPQGKRLERIRQSPHYKDGAFQNLHETVMMTSDKSRFRSILDFLFRKVEGLRPEKEIPVIKTNLQGISNNKDVLVWFGHSSYLIQIDGKRILVDPVFCMGSPVSFINKPFPATYTYQPNDMPDIDYLVITHDHWDHLDYQTIMQLKDRIRKIICPLGVGEHFEYWGFEEDQLIELDWYENSTSDNEAGLSIHCLPARHFSGRGLTANQTLWGSFLIETSSKKIFIGGDGGYDTHFEEIGNRYPGIDLAILENGQYNEDWKYIHTMPSELNRVAKDLKARKILTVHHSKFALAKHRWDEPIMNVRKMIETDSLNVLNPVIGEVVNIDK